MSGYTLPFTRAQVDRIFNLDTGAFDVGLQLVDMNHARAFRDPLEAVLALGGFDLSSVLSALNSVVYRGNQYSYPYLELSDAGTRVLTRFRSMNFGSFASIDWRFLERQPLLFKDWHMVIEVQRAQYIAKAVIHIKGRDLEAIEKGEHTRADLNMDLLRG